MAHDAVEWNFSLFSVYFNGSGPVMWKGPTTGPVVTENFTATYAGQNGIYDAEAIASVVTPANVTLADNTTQFEIPIGNTGSSGGTVLNLSASPQNGTAPFS